MKSICAEMKKRIPMAMLGELSAVEQIELETHLLNCPVCKAENACCVETFAQLHTISDVSAPRHFLVYPGDARRSLKDFFWALEPGWKLVLSTGLISVFLLLALFLTQFQLKVENGVYLLSFGKPLPVISAISQNREAEIKSQWMELLDGRSHQDRWELIKLIKQELTAHNQEFSAQQKKEWQSALFRLEGRLRQQIAGNSLALQSGINQSVVELYQTVQSQRQQDMTRTRRQLDRLAYQEDQKDQETKEILATLLQVTDMKLK